MTAAGLPHSEIAGSPGASPSPAHFAAWPRPSSAAGAKASTVRPYSQSVSSLRRTRLRPPRGPAPVIPVHTALARSRRLRPPSSTSLLGIGSCLNHMYATCVSSVPPLRQGMPARLGGPGNLGSGRHGELSKCREFVENNDGRVSAPVEPRGLEPRTSAVQRRRSPS